MSTAGITPTTSDLKASCFRYDEVDETTASRVQRLTDRIRSRESEYALQTGLDLIEVQEALGHGRFGTWLATEFGWTDRTARNLMAAARFVEGKSETISGLPVTALYQLAAPSLPAQIREAIVARVEGGETLSIKEIKTEIGREKERYAAEQQEQRRLARRAKMSLSDLGKELTKEKSRWRRRERKEEDRRRQQEEDRRRQDEQDRAADEIVALLTERFGDDLPKLLELLSKTSWYKVQDRLKVGMSAPSDPRMVKIAELWERVSAKGTRYFSGYMGDAQILMFDGGERDHPTRPGEKVHVWKLMLQERDASRRPRS